MFPLPPEALDDQRVLLIGLVEADPGNAYFVVGIASWSGTRLRVAYDSRFPSVEPTGTAAAWRGFAPQMLPSILLPKALHRVAPLLGDVAACVVAWVPEPIPAALVIANAFFGLAANTETGEVFLMQGTPSIVEMLSQRPDLGAAT